MNVQVVGCSHHGTSIGIRERLAFGRQQAEEALQQWRTSFRDVEGVLLSTCNRVEIAVTSPDEEHPAAIMERFLKAWQGSATAFEGHLYQMESRAAIQHLFRVAAIFVFLFAHRALYRYVKI